MTNRRAATFLGGNRLPFRRPLFGRGSEISKGDPEGRGEKKKNLKKKPLARKKWHRIGYRLDQER